ncbi:MAG TPA: hypothetical protein VGK67_10210 [Myxococcales bacterium]|jgi:hypothetical protein
MTLPGAAAALLVTLLAADEGRAEHVLVVAPRPPASPTLVALTQAVTHQLARSGRHVVIPDSVLRKALEESKGPALPDLDDPAQIALVLQLVDADYLVSVVSPRTLIVRSAKPGKPSGRLVATMGGEPADVAMDLIRQLDRPLESPTIAPPPPLARLGERVQLELRVSGGAEMSAKAGEYAVSVGFEAPFTSRWSVGGSVGLKLGTLSLDLRESTVADGAALAKVDTNFRLPIAVDLRWAFLKGGNWLAQAAVGIELAYVGLSSARGNPPSWSGTALVEVPAEPTSYGLSAGPSLAVQLGYLMSDRFQVRVGVRYVAAYLASPPVVTGTIYRAPDFGGEPVDLTPTSRLSHELHGFLAIDLSL